MRVYDDGVITVHPEAIEDIHDWTEEDLEHLKDAIIELQELTKAIALPGLEAVYFQIQLRINRKKEPHHHPYREMDGIK